MVQSFINKSRALLESENKSILSAAFIIAASYLASALLGLVRNHLLAARFFGGLEADLDVYFAAFVLPDTIFQLLVVGAVSAAFIPLFQESAKESYTKAYELANAALTFIGGLMFVFTVLLFIFARPVADLITHYDGRQLDVMANLIRLMSTAQLFFTISAFLTGILQARRRFLIPAIAPLLYNLGTIIGILLLSKQIGIYAAGVGVVLGALLHFLIQIPFVIRLGFRPHLTLNFSHTPLFTMLKLMPPRALSLGIEQIERYIAVNITSLLAAGSLSIFSFARQLYVLPISLFGVSLGQASFPSLSDEASSPSRREEFIKVLNKTILQVCFFSLPASVLVLVLRVPLVRLAFGAKNFPWEATLLTGRVLASLAITITLVAVGHVLTRAFYALKDTRTPLIIATSTMIVFVVSSYYLSRVQNLGVLGVTIGMSISNIVDFLLLYYFLRRRLGALRISHRILWMIATSFFTGLALWLPMRLLDQFVFDTTRTIPLILLTLTVSSVGFMVYLVFSKIFQIEEFSDVVAMFKHLGNWRKVLSRSDEVIETSVDSNS